MSFDTDSAWPQFSDWVFHGIDKDRNGWFANTSKDRGETSEKTWMIEGVRRR